MGGLLQSRLHEGNRQHRDWDERPRAVWNAGLSRWRPFMISLETLPGEGTFGNREDNPRKSPCAVIRNRVGHDGAEDHHHVTVPAFGTNELSQADEPAGSGDVLDRCDSSHALGRKGRDRAGRRVPRPTRFEGTMIRRWGYNRCAAVGTTAATTSARPSAQPATRLNDTTNSVSRLALLRLPPQGRLAVMGRLFVGIPQPEQRSFLERPRSVSE